MGKIYCLMGKSSSGKDTLYQMLMDRQEVSLLRIVPYTTRPMRKNETEGLEYHFTDEEGLQRLRDAGRVIEERAYQTIHGIWRYFTVDDESIDLNANNYLIISTIEAYENLVNYYPKDRVVPIYITVDDGLRLQRALERERAQEIPRYAEMCRRFLADEEDFSEEKLEKAGIEESFENLDLEVTYETILLMIRESMNKESSSNVPVS